MTKLEQNCHARAEITWFKYTRDQSFYRYLLHWDKNNKDGLNIVVTLEEINHSNHVYCTGIKK